MPEEKQEPKVVAVHDLWIILKDEHERDEFGRRPYEWEGPGEYRLVELEPNPNSENENGYLVLNGGKYHPWRYEISLPPEIIQRSIEKGYIIRKKPVIAQPIVKEIIVGIDTLELLLKEAGRLKPNEHINNVKVVPNELVLRVLVET